MNCEQVEQDLTDLARNGLVDAAAEQRVLEHVETCGECAERLASQRELTAALRGLAEEASAVGAPEGLEGVLRRSFRQRRSGWGRRHAWVAAGAVAAGILVYLAMRGPEVAPVRLPKAAFVKREEPRPANSGLDNRSLTVAARKSATSRKGTTSRQSTKSKRYAGRDTRPAMAAREVATPFLALRDFDPNEPTTVVRVKLPRASLAAFGLPMNEDREMDRVKADVVLGEDGLARAVRFVH